MLANLNLLFSPRNRVKKRSIKITQTFKLQQQQCKQLKHNAKRTGLFTAPSALQYAHSKQHNSTALLQNMHRPIQRF